MEIITKIEKKVKQTIDKHKLLNKKDKVVVALSGGKDSTSVLYILHKLGYNVSGFMIDLHLGEWSKKNRENVEGFCSKLGIDLNVYDMKKELGQGICFIKQIVKEKKNLTGCSVCGIMKKWIINKEAKRLKADKLVTGHNLDDECQTVLMNFLKGNVYLGANSSPATNQGELDDSGLFVQRVKPLFFIAESDIRKYSKEMKFPVLYERCPCAFGTYRVETRAWMELLSDKEKLKIVESWQDLIPSLKEVDASSGGRGSSRDRSQNDIRRCNVCGEGSNKDVCNACEIFACFGS